MELGRAVVVVCAIAVILAGIAIWQWRARNAEDARTIPPPAEAGVSVEAGAGVAGFAPGRAVKLTASERGDAAARIARARAEGSAGGDAGVAGDARDAIHVPDAMRLLSDELRACDDAASGPAAAGSFHAVVELKLTGAPGVGTVIDVTPGAVDDRGAVLPAELDVCIRATLGAVLLPPVVGGDDKLSYPFPFEQAPR